jgi:hypothetical protein
MNTTDQKQGEEASNYEETHTKIVPVDETSVDEPDQDTDQDTEQETEQGEPGEEKPRNLDRLSLLDDLEVEERPASQSKTSQEIRIMPSMGLTGPKKKSGSGEIQMGTRAQWAEMIKQHAPTLMAYHKRVALSANEVLAALKANDLMVQDIEHANGIGDALGACGLRLPPVVGAGPKHYYIPAANMTAEERAEFDALSALDKVRLIREGNAALKDGEA